MTPDGLVLVDEESLADLGRYAARARSLDPDAAVRLQAVGQVLAAWVGVLPGHGLMGDGTVLGLRTFALATAADHDVTVPVQAITDRTARGTHVLPIPPTRAFPQWGALTPPRAGWEPVGTLAAATLIEAATAGIREIGIGAGPGSGALAVADLRSRVWGRPLDAVPAVSAGVGFAAYGLGFLTPDAIVPVHRSGPWRRLACPGGYVLIR